MAKIRPARPAGSPPPTVPPCMLFCDGVIVEQRTGKTTLVGTFSTVAAASFPTPPRDLHIYVQMTSFVGDVEVRLACYLADHLEDEVYATAHTVNFRGKLIVEELHFVWSQFQFPGAGEYLFQLWCQEHCIAQRRLMVRLKRD